MPAPRGYQEECIGKVLSAWDNALPAVVTAGMGTGKTYIGAFASYYWRADYVIVVGPLASLFKWRNVLSELFRQDQIFAVTPQAWTTAPYPGEYKANHPYLYKSRNSAGGYDFIPSPVWKNMCTNYRTIFILDEFHLYQNPSQRTFAVSASSRYILLNNNQSRVLLLSFTPSSQIRYVPLHMYLMGIICRSKESIRENKNIVNYNNKNGVLDEILSYAESLGYDSDQILEEMIGTTDRNDNRVLASANELCSEIFLEVIKQDIVFSYVADFEKKTELHPSYENIFCKVTNRTIAKERVILSGGGPPSEDVITFTHLPKEESVGMAILNVKRHRLENLKIPIIIAQAEEHLIDIPGGKVIIMVEYIDALTEIFNYFNDSGYGVTVLQGELSTKKRNKAIELFQQHNSIVRVIVATLPTGGVSVDLHDTSPKGSFPRLMIIPPSVMVKDVVQAAGRVFRDGVTSKPTVRIIYCIDEEGKVCPEDKFYTNISDKSNTIKRYHAVGQTSTLPCDYQNYITVNTYLTEVD